MDGGGIDALLGWSVCAEIPAPLRASGTIVELPIEPVLDGQPFVYGEANPLSGGGEIVPLNFRFYLSQVELLTSGGGAVAVDVVSAAGVPQPYDVYMFNAETSPPEPLRVLAPAGSYAGMRFLVGVNEVCNASNVGRGAPLSATSQMVWPGPFGYLFLRFEGLLSGTWTSDAGAPPPTAIHMGGVPGTLFAPVVRVDGALSVPATGTVTRRLRIAIDQIFIGATTGPEPTVVIPGSETEAGERLRINAPSLPLFTFGP
jgi:hypothetical protein